jgi:LL-H family phage holin
MAFETLSLITLSMQVLVFILGIVWLIISPRLKKDKLTATQQTADSVVAYVEQKAGDLSGDEKRKQAVDMTENILKMLGYKSVPPELIDTAIEASVFALKQGVSAYNALKSQLTPKPTTLRATVQDLTNKPQ